jgi:hypothetical protein
VVNALADDGIHTTGPTTRRGGLAGGPGYPSWPIRLFPLGEKAMGSGVGKAPGTAILAGDEVLAIARADASRVYRDLSALRIQLVLEEDGWHVDYELKDPRFKGGGPHYLIDAHTGKIVAKRYEQ